MECLEHVERAFDGVSYPGDDALTIASSCPDVLEVDEFFTGRDRTEVTVDALWAAGFRSTDVILGFLSASAFRYYLPTFLRLAVETPDDPLANFKDYGAEAILLLSPPWGEFEGELPEAGDANLQHAWQRRVDALSVEQRRAVAATIVEMFEKRPEQFQYRREFERAFEFWTA